MIKQRMQGLSVIHVLGILVFFGIVALLVFGETDNQKRERMAKESPPPASETEATKSTPVPQQPATTGNAEKAKELAATMINLNGHLCAKVIEIRQLKVRPEVHEVTCVEYRGGTGRKVYLLDSNKGTAWIP